VALAQAGTSRYHCGVSRRGRPDEPDVERLPRGRGLRLSTPEIFRIIMVAALLVAVIAMQGPCSDAVGRFVAGFDPPPPASLDAAATPDPPGGYVRLRSDMTEAELRQAVDQARSATAPTDASAAAPPPTAPAAGHP
jgi:hypothetical protein